MSAAHDLAILAPAQGESGSRGRVGSRSQCMVAILRPVFADEFTR
jgi:hypothetical protein